MHRTGLAARVRACGCLVAFGIGAVASLELGAVPVFAQVSTQVAEWTPAQIVAFRFPPSWGPSTASNNRPARVAAAGAVNNPLFNPQPTYQLASANAAAESDQSQALAYAPAQAAAPVKTAALATEPVKRAPPVRSRYVFNDAQISSIKNRLQLTDYQSQYWPPIEAALREIQWKKAQDQAAKTAIRGEPPQTVDVNSPGVQKLKSAAVPLVMMLSEQQKQEVRRLAHVVGLGAMAAQF